MYGILLASVLICWVLVILTKEIIQFTRKATKHARGIFIKRQTVPPPLINIEDLVNYDCNYLYKYVPEQTDLNTWCSFLTEEVYTTVKREHARVIGIYYFQCKVQQTLASMTFTGPRARHYLVVVPVRQTATYVTLLSDNHAAKVNMGHLAIASQGSRLPCELKIVGDAFFVVIIQPFLAWDF